MRSPKRTKSRKTIYEKLDESAKSAIRGIVRDFHTRDEIPTLSKILKKINENGIFGTFKKSTLHTLLKKLGFEFDRKGVILDLVSLVPEIYFLQIICSLNHINALTYK